MADDDSTVNAVRTARNRAGISQRELARRSGVSQPNIAAIESGRRAASEQLLDRLLAASRTTPSQALEQHRDDVRRILAMRGGSDPRVFGSVARGADTVASDLDLLVTFAPGTLLWDVVGAQLDLEELLGVPVDVVPDDGDSRAVANARQESVPL